MIGLEDITGAPSGRAPRSHRVASQRVASGARTQGLSRNLGDLPISPANNDRVGPAETRTRPGERPRWRRRLERTSRRGAPSHEGGAPGRETRGRGTDREDSEHSIVPTKAGNRTKGPGGGKRVPVHTTVGGKDGRPTDAEHRLNETSTDSNTGQTDARDGDALAVPPPRLRVAARSLAADPERRGRRRGRRDGGGVRDQPGCEPRPAARPSQVGRLPCPTGPAGPSDRVGSRKATERSGQSGSPPSRTRSSRGRW